MARNRSPVPCCQPVDPRTPAKECTANSLPALMLSNTCNLRGGEQGERGWGCQEEAAPHRSRALEKRLGKETARVTSPARPARGLVAAEVVGAGPAGQTGQWVSAFTFSCSVKLSPARLGEWASPGQILLLLGLLAEASDFASSHQFHPTLRSCQRGLTETTASWAGDVFFLCFILFLVANKFWTTPGLV